MIVVMAPGHTRAERDAVARHIEEAGLRTQIMEGVERTVIGLDHMVVRVERRAETPEAENEALARAVVEDIKNQILVTVKVEVLSPGTLPRSFAKTKRVIDEREKD